MPSYETHKRTAEGRHIALDRKARRAVKYVGKPLDVSALMASLPQSRRVA